MQTANNVRPPVFRGAHETGDWSLHVHQSLHALEVLESDWRRLTPGSASPFQTFSWNHAWYRCFASGDGTPLIFEIKKEGETAAILPCYFEGKSIRLAGDRICGHQDVIALEAEAADAALRLSMDWLKTEAKRYHYQFEKLSNEGFLFKSLHRPDCVKGETLMFEKSRSLVRSIELNGGFEEFFSTLPAEAQRDLGEVLFRLEREAPVARVVKLRDFQVRVDDLNNAATFHIEHFRKEGGSALLDERLIQFLGEVAKDPDVGFQLSCLTNQGDILAVDFGFVRGGRYHGYLAASDEAFGRLEPGDCLFIKRINSWVRVDKVRSLEFSATDKRYPKAFYSASAREVCSIRLMPQDLRNRARNIGLESNKQIRRFARTALEKTAILPR